MALVRLAARDPGGANVLASFLERHAASVPCDVWTLPRATPVFVGLGFQPREFAETVAPGALGAAWHEHPAQFLITDTSHYGAFEPLLWDLARTAGVRSLAVLDAWGNLPARFARGRPDFVGAVDAGQVEELTGLGFLRQEVVLTGHPWLSSLLARRDRLLAEIEPAQTPPGVKALFISESIAKDVAAGENAPFGFDEFDAFSLLHRAAAQAARTGRAVHLAIKFHPYEDPAAFLGRLRHLPTVRGLTVLPLERAAEPHRWVLWADLVAGVSSTLLLEAIILGKPVISLQPGLIREDTFVASQRGFTEKLTDPTPAVARLTELIQSAPARAALWERNAAFLSSLPADSSAAILHLIQRHLDP